MTGKHILHMLTPLKHMSPFDVNMAADCGFETIATYTNVTRQEVTGLVQDAMFSRPPSDAMRTGIFIGGKDVLLALDMLDYARKAMFPPFEVSLFADPAGSFTTAAAMVACVERSLKKTGGALNGSRVSVFGATGVVGFTAAVILAQQGAKVTLAGYDGVARVEKAAAEIGSRFGLHVAAADGSNDLNKAAILNTSEIALCAARAGVMVVNQSLLRAAEKLRIVADVNAVQPAGVEGLDIGADDQILPETQILGIGPLTIGNIKYQTEAGLFRQMIAARKAVAYDFKEAFALARRLTS